MPFNPNSPMGAYAPRPKPGEGIKFNWGGGLKGAVVGAGTGFMAGGVPGAIIGAGGGLVVGGNAAGAQDKANSIRQSAADQAIASQAGIARDMEARRAQDLERTMGFYSPALQQLEHLYGIPMSAWGQGLAQNRPAPPPPVTGRLPDGRVVQEMPGMKGAFGAPLGRPVQSRPMTEMRPLAGLAPLDWRSR